MLRRIRAQWFLIGLVGAAIVGVLLPARGQGLDVLSGATPYVIGFLFFLYGARLSTRETVDGIRNVRLQAAVLVTTFVAFPLVGLASRLLEPSVLPAGLAAGVLLLTLVPSTVQSNVTNTRIAGGDTASAVVAASISNLLGVFLTPLLVAWLMAADAKVDAASVLRIVLQLLAPFVLGQLLRPWIGEFVTRHDKRLMIYDRASILLVVYAAYSRGSAEDVWSSVSVGSLLVVAAVCVVVLAIAMGWTWGLGRVLRLPRRERIPLLFCGCNKSLASGLPIASVLFPPHTVALIILPLMIYHQLQILIGSIVAERLAKTA